MTGLVVLVGVWVGGAVLCGYVAEQRQRSGPAWSLLALLFSPLLIMLALLAIPMGAPLVPAPNRDAVEGALDRFAATKAFPIVFVAVIVLGLVLLFVFGD